MIRAPNRPPYLLVVLGHERLGNEVIGRVREAVERQLKQDPVAVERRAPPAAIDPAVPEPNVVVLACFTQAGDLHADELRDAEGAIEAGIPVLPVVAHGFSPSSLPAPLSRLNAMSWDEDPEGVGLAVIRLLGLVEEDRKVFISYKRSDSDGISDQLRHALQDRGFDVFLDRYSVPPGADFQRRLDTDLADKAFVVLLESEDIASSEWVLHEVTFALRQQISLVALALPWVRPGARLRSVPDDFRVFLVDDDIEPAHLRRQRVLAPEALERVVWRLEWEHARRLRRHREQLVDTLSDWLRQKGHDVAALPGWALAATGGAHNGVYVVTPRAPTPEDLHRASGIRERIAPGTPAVVAHNPEWLDEQRRALMDWIAEGRELRTEHHAGLRLTIGAS